MFLSFNLVINWRKSKWLKNISRFKVYLSIKILFSTPRHHTLLTHKEKKKTTNKTIDFNAWLGSENSFLEGSVSRSLIALRQKTGPWCCSRQPKSVPASSDEFTECLCLSRTLWRWEEHVRILTLSCFFFYEGVCLCAGINLFCFVVPTMTTSTMRKVIRGSYYEPIKTDN